jgi:hypothetical protein
MPARILDARIVGKLGTKLAKDATGISKLVSARGARLGISSEAALVLLAKENGIGAATYLRRLEPSKQAEVRDALPAAFTFVRPPAKGAVGGNAGSAKRGTISKRASLKAAVEYLVQDPELQSRCGDILLAPRNFDRPVNQATLVLEDRIRKKAEPPKKLVGENLVGYAFNEELDKTVLRVASNEPDDQRGFTQILRGVVPAFRNRTHHHITNTFSREEALRVCGFIDVLLRVVDNSVKR